jgi:hypothetical protein
LAAECLDLARRTTDQGARASLLLMAQRWMELASEKFGERRFGGLLDEFNEHAWPSQDLTRSAVQPRGSASSSSRSARHWSVMSLILKRGGTTPQKVLGSDISGVPIRTLRKENAAASHEARRKSLSAS